MDMDIYSSIFYICLLPFILAEPGSDFHVTYLDAGESIKHEPVSARLGFYETQLEVYCYRGSPKSIPRIFHTVAMQLEIENDDFTQYEGSTPEAVKENYDEQRSIFNLNILSYKRTRKILNPFNQTCIGIETVQPYRVRLILVRLDFYKVILLCLGLFTFWFASKLSNNSIFYYITGILLGIFASFVVLVYLLSKLFPRRPVMYGVLIGGWTIAIYLFQMVWENIQVILRTHQTFVLWYIFITGLISFVICYRFGPPKNQRSRDLIKWGLQLTGLVMIFFSSEYEEASVAVMLMVTLGYYFPQRWLNKVRLLYLRKFPPKPRLLNNEEYYEQGVRETTRALDDLREYCSSPECKQWRIVTKLKDPVKFASFMEGSSHILDEEILQYETSRIDATDSELSEDEEERQNLQHNNQQEDISEDEDDNVEETYGQSSLRIQKASTSRNGSVVSPGRGTSASSRASSRKVIYRSYGNEYSDGD